MDKVGMDRTDCQRNTLDPVRTSADDPNFGISKRNRAKPFRAIDARGYFLGRSHQNDSCQHDTYRPDGAKFAL